MYEAVIIKMYADGSRKIMQGKIREGESVHDGLIRILHENGVYNRGELIVLLMNENAVFLHKWLRGIGGRFADGMWLSRDTFKDLCEVI